MELTHRQASILSCIQAYSRQNGFSPTVREICTELGLASPSGVHRVLQALINKGLLLSDSTKNRSLRLTEAGRQQIRMPLPGIVAAGQPLGVLDDLRASLDIDPRFFGGSDCYALKVQGDSMIDAHILDGDYAVLTPCSRAMSGTIVAVMIDDVMPEATLKVFVQKDYGIELKPANQAYSSFYFWGADQDRVRIVGKLVGVIRRCDGFGH